MDARDRIILALDVDNLREVERLVEQCYEYIGWYKIGLRLVVAVGIPTTVRFLQEMNVRIFLDGKFKDVPKTIADAAAEVASLGVDMFSIDASGHPDMIKAAVQNKGGSLVLALTELTSKESTNKTTENALEKALRAAEAGVDGLISSPLELKTFAREPKLNGLLRITPGIRPAWAEKSGGHKRAMSPFEAFREGSDKIVIGNPVYDPPSKIATPANASRLVSQESAIALEGVQK